MLASCVSLLTILVAIHWYIPVSLIVALLNSRTLVLDDSPFIILIVVSEEFLIPLDAPFSVHSIFGTGLPVALHVRVNDCPAVTFCVCGLVTIIGPTIISTMTYLYNSGFGHIRAL